MAYVLYYLDRSDVADVGSDMLRDTGMSGHDSAVAMMVYLVASGLFAVPSNVLLKLARPSRWFAVLMFIWGAVSMCLGVATNGSTVIGVRFLIGVFQAGFLPGLVYYLAFWYRADERSLRIALVLGVGGFIGSFGGAVAYAVDGLDEAHDGPAWRWLFIIEGAPSCLVALLVLFFLPDFPESATWLSPPEVEFAMGRLYLEGAKRSDRALVSWKEARDTLFNPRLCGHALLYFAVSAPVASLTCGLFTPAVTAGLGYAGVQVPLMNVPLYAVAAVVQIVAAWSADRFNARGVHAAVLAAVGAFAFLAAAVLYPEAYAGQYACLILGAAAALGCVPLLLGWLSYNVVGTAPMGLAVAMNVGLAGAAGQIVGVWTYADAGSAPGGYSTGHWVNCLLLFGVTAGCVLLHFQYRGLNNKIRMETGGGDRVRFFKY